MISYITHYNLNPTMKVFSKTNKHNKSTPALNTLAALPHPIAASKPKSSNKLKTFKQILTQNVQITALKSHDNMDSAYNQNNNRPKTQRNRSGIEMSSDSHYHAQNNSFLGNTPAIKMISSLNYKNVHTDTDVRSSSESVQKIESVVYYGIHKNGANMLNASCFHNNQNKAINSSSENVNKLNVSCKSQKYGNHINSKQVEVSNFNKENDLRRINHYKNSKIISNSKLVPKRQWSLSNFRMGRKIGRGRFGSVYVVQQKQTGAIFALKKIDMIQVKQQQMESQIMQEIKLQLFMNYPNIIKLYGYFRQQRQLCLILEYAQDKCLFSKLAQKIDERQVSYYTMQMIKALRYCHSESILHRDLKPQNILLCFGVAKLADFGWAAYAPKYKRSTFCGTLDYVPPEIIKGNYYDEKVDIWSLGVLIYEMAIGYAPFETHPNDPSMTEQLTMKRIVEGDLRIPMSLSEQLRKLIESILSTDPDNRPSLEDIEKSVWMQRYRQEGIEISRLIWDFWSSLVDR